ncbi:serine O-acetyltransferase [Erysipelothrix urinaevulpis]|uniref:serine O-acetyltransferase n=1 Tax=Erysipelothrix urinaevulpis TaxID=2683717 RepID=UPI0013586131|nr:serine O-acetyltransferase [Erysipelothrix urinaevulpis]
MAWLETARAYKKKDPAVKSVLEVIFLYPGYHVMGFYRIAHFFYKVHLYFIARLISQVGRFFTQIEIHPGAVIGKRFVIDHGSGVVIGETAVVGDDCHIHHGVTLGSKSTTPCDRHPKLGDNVLVGAGAQIIGNIKIGSDSVIGANAVVVKEVMKNDVVAGIPAKSIKKK